MPYLPASMSKILLCSSIASNALCAGGMFTFPLMSPSLAAHLNLNQTQLTAIVLAGLMSQYPIAVFVGWLIDQYGPSLCSLVAALMFTSGFAAFAWEVNILSNGAFQSSQTMLYRLSFYFLMIGLGTVFSYCSSLFAASKIFPGHIGLASGCSMALFGLSPLFLSVIATSFFMDATTDLLNVSAFSCCLAVLCGVVYLTGFIILRHIPLVTQSPTPIASGNTMHVNAEESSPLLGPAQATNLMHSHNPDVMELLTIFDFWLLAIFCICILGTSEMIISNIGTIVLSLPSTSIQLLPKQHFTALQVKLISLANTISRIVIGPLADLISPLPNQDGHGFSIFIAKRFISRAVFLPGAACLLTGTLLWTRLSIYYQDQLWVLSIGTGISYSAVFTILPGLMSSLWGIQHLGRNFGIMMYAPFTGTPLFSYIYALVSESHTADGAAICQGRSCWELTMSLCITACSISLILSLILWKRWQDII